MFSDRPYARMVLQFSGIFAAFVITLVIIYVDILALGSVMGEGSLVEISQALLILGSAVFFALGARHHADLRGYLLLVSTLFICMFIRENDGLLDPIDHGFWKVPVLIIAILGGFAVFKHRSTLRSGLKQHAQDSSFWILTVGLLQLIVFSRLFGSGKLWKNIPNQADLALAKTIIQEGTELVSYSLVFLGACLSYRYLFGKRPPKQQP